MSSRARAETLCFHHLITINQAREMMDLDPLPEGGDRTGVWDIGAGSKDREIDPYLAQAVDYFFDVDGFWISQDDRSRSTFTNT